MLLWDVRHHHKTRIVRYTVVVALVAVMISGCATPPPKGEVVQLSMPFHYQGLGAGANPVDNSIELTEGTEADQVSRAIVEALQSLEYSLIEPALSLGKPIPQNTEWSSDRVPIAQREIATHNEKFPDWPLPPRHYSVQYSGSYKLERRELIIRLSAHLFEGALASEPRPYRKDYSGNYFVHPLEEALKEKLLKLKEQAPL